MKSFSYRPSCDGHERPVLGYPIWPASSRLSVRNFNSRSIAWKRASLRKGPSSGRSPSHNDLGPLAKSIWSGEANAHYRTDERGLVEQRSSSNGTPPSSDCSTGFTHRSAGAEIYAGGPSLALLEISLSVIDEGDYSRAGALRDVTDCKHVEAELTVAREYAERARDEANRANLAKSRFLATASHDLRQPLQSLSLLNGTLRRIVTEPDAADALWQQEQAIGAMSRLLNALLDISKLESGAIKPELTDFTVAALFTELRSDFASLAANKGLKLQVPDECTDCVHSDPSLVQQILSNLVSNAIKYTQEGWVRLRCLNEQGLVRIDVLDTGIGIPADQVRYIYDEFYQVGVPTNASRDGYGLGLSIVQRLVKLLDLKLDVRSEFGKGSAFSLLLPASRSRVKSPYVRSGRTPLCQPRAGEPHVLLVDDDQAVRDATRMLLRVEGYRVTAVSSLTEALQKARDDARLDLLITDYHLSEGETGLQIITALRERFGLPLKAVLITGDTSSAIKELPLDPCLRITSKPVRADELLTLLRELLAN